MLPTCQCELTPVAWQYISRLQAELVLLQFQEPCAKCLKTHGAFIESLRVRT